MNSQIDTFGELYFFLSPFVQFSLVPFGQGLNIARGGEIVAFDSMWRLQ